MQRICTFSGGLGSWGAARRVIERHGPDEVTLLFTDTLMEDEDLYRFIDEAAPALFGDKPARLVRLAEGRDPWQVFFDERFLGNSKRDPCSKILKRRLFDSWLKANCDPADTIVYVGIDWTEEHRFTELRDRRGQDGWRYEAPLCEAPWVTKDDVGRALAASGIKKPRLYAMGFSHNNCGGFCIKAGIGHFILLLRTFPERYAYHEAKEQEIRAYLGKNVTILRDRRKKRSRPMTLRELRERVEAGEQFDMFEIGGCGCFTEAA